MEDSQNISTTVWPNYYISGYLSEEHGNTNLKRYVHPFVYCTVIYNNQDIETAYVCISGWMDKDVTYIYKEWNPVATTWMDIPWRYYVK